MPVSCALLVAVVLVSSAQPTRPAPPPADSGAASVPAAAPESAEARARAYYDFLLARRLESEGDVDGAVAALRRAAAADPWSGEVRAELASLYARQNRADDALKAAEAALAVDPDNAEAHWVIGTIAAALLQGGQEAGVRDEGANLERAIEHLEKARPARAYDLGLVLTLGRLYLAKPDYPKAADTLGSLVQREPGVTEAGFLLAQALEGAGRRADAVETLQRTLALEPRFFRAWMLLGEFLEKDRRYKEAAGAYEQAARQGNRSSELRLRQASALLAAGAPGAARDVLEEVVTSSPTDVAALSLLTEAQRQARDLDAAEATARRVAALDPKGVRGPYALALVLEQRRDFAGVVGTLAPVLDEQADARSDGNRMYLGALVRLGYAYQELGRFDEAIAVFERARRSWRPTKASATCTSRRRRSPRGGTRRAIAIARPEANGSQRTRASPASRPRPCARAGGSTRPSRCCAGAWRLAPDVALSLSLATVLGEARRSDEALAGARRGRDATSPANSTVPFQRGALLEQQKRFAEAEQAFRAVLARDPAHAPTLNYLGYMLVERGEQPGGGRAPDRTSARGGPGNPSYLDSLGWA